MAGTGPSLVDYLTLGASLVAAAGTVLGWWHERSKKNEFVDGYMEWIKAQSDDGDYYFFPTLVIHNRSSDSVAVSDVALCRGWAFRTRSRNTALAHEDSDELAFPYIVKPGVFWKSQISNHNFAAALNNVSFARLAWIVGRPSIWLRVETIRGTTLYIDAMRMIADKNMPNWLKQESEE